MRRSNPKLVAGIAMLAVWASWPLGIYAATAEEINASVDAALERFASEVEGGDDFLEIAKGVLVLPDVIKAGLIVGGEYGEGALRVGGETVEYYSTAAGSFGLQAGAQSKAVFLLFLQQEALDNFRASSGWKAGVDGSIVMIEVGAAGSLDTIKSKDPIVGFVISNAGLMADVSLAGSKYTKIVR